MRILAASTAFLFLAQWPQRAAADDTKVLRSNAAKGATDEVYPAMPRDRPKDPPPQEDLEVAPGLPRPRPTPPPAPPPKDGSDRSKSRSRGMEATN